MRGGAVGHEFDVGSLRTAVVDRRRLRRLLDGAEEDGRSVVTITAQAGWGKTTLLDQWCSDPARRAPVVRVGMAEVVAEHRSLESATARAFVRVTGTTREDLTDAFVVAIDDVHLIESHADRETFETLCRSLLPGQFLVSSGRSQPVAVTRQLRGWTAVEVGQWGLAFSPREADELVRLSGIRLEPADLADLVGHTQGQPFTLALFAQVAAASTDPHAVVERLIHDPGLAAEHLVEALLGILPPRVADNIVALSVLDEVSIPIAAHLTGSADIGSTLEWLCTSTTLLGRRPSTDEDAPYAFDETFRQHLAHALRRRDAGRPGRLHVSAAEWLVARGDYRAAVEHAVSSESTELVQYVLQTHGLGLIFSGDVAVVHGALTFLESRGVITGLTALLSALLCAPHLLDSVRVDHFIHLAQEGLSSMSAAARLAFRALVAMRARDDEQARRALSDLDAAVAAAAAAPSDASTPANMLDALLFAEAARAICALWLGESDSAVRIAVRAADDAHESSRPWLATMLLDIGVNAAARAGAWQLQVSLELQIAEQSTDDATPTDIVTAHSQFAVAAAAYQACEPYSAERLMDIIQTEWRNLDPGLSVPPRVLRVLFELDSEPDARPLYERMERMLESAIVKHPRTLAVGSFRYIDLTLRYRGRMTARDAVGLLSRSLGPSAFETRLATAQIHGGTALQDAEELALEGALLDRPHAWHGSNLVFGWILLATWAAEAGREEQVEARLQGALELGERMRCIRPFLAGGGAAARLVEQRQGAFGASGRFAEAVVDAYRRLVPDARRVGTVDPALLTPRERDLLRELPLHQSVSDIARKHTVSPNTVKTHLRSIYQKLGATDRASAVENARRVGLL
ncbi:LuxR C-terminal-related transcriptional regulator [Leifsonia sp. Le1]|uniref:LuxR C-terminal-related transcriptional regulator n=1 Tax=Leifsonia sp. Le1 TaxID=3404918 RepID=UPI003EC032A2